MVSIGEAPILDYLPQDDSIKKFRDWVVPNKDNSILDGVFVAGDVIKPGRLTDAIGSGQKAAYYADAYVMNKEVEAFPEKQQVNKDTLAKAYFDKCHHCNLGEPADDVNRCISCGTCRDCETCMQSCPEKAITRIQHLDGSFEYVSDAKKCIGCGICARRLSLRYLDIKK